MARNSPSLKKLLFGTIKRKLILGFFTVTLVTIYVLVSVVSKAVENPELYNKYAGQINAGYVFLAILAVTALLSTGIGYIMSRSITDAIKKLQVATQKVELGNFRARVEINTGDELEELGNAFNKTTAALEDTERERQQLDKAKTEFLSITGHELRSPMTPMKAQLQMYLEGYFGRINKKQRNSLEIVFRNTVRLDRIIMDFLEISRIEAARLKFKFIRTRLTEHIDQLVDEMRGFMPEKNIKLISNVGKLPVIEIDPDRAMQVLRNLINNAIKFSKNNSKVIVDVKLKGGMIQFSVQDQGIGIAPENRKRVFEPFYQEEQTMYRKYSGTGLGLAICRGIIESQNGRIWLKSELAKGSTFYFTIPLKPAREIKPIKVLFSPPKSIPRRSGK